MMARLHTSLGLLCAGGLLVLAGCASRAPVAEVAVAAPVPPVLASQTPGQPAAPKGAAAALVAPAPTPTLVQVAAELGATSLAQGVQITSQPDGGLLLRASGDAAFASGKALLSPRYKAFLKELVRQLQAHPGVKASVLGHSDSQGTAKGNEQLSLARARAVQHELVVQGVAAQRLSAEGRGAREPVADNDSADGRAANRRVDILLASDAP